MTEAWAVEVSSRSGHPEPGPDDARPEYADRCCHCIAAPRTVVWKMVTRSGGDPAVYPKAAAGVLELQFCGHLADRLEDALTSEGWVVVLDRRQALIRHEARSADSLR